MIGTLVVAGLCSFGLTEAKAQSCYLTGSIEFWGDLFPGAERPTAYAFTSVTSNTNGWDVSLPMDCFNNFPTAIGVEVGWVGSFNSRSCLNGGFNPPPFTASYCGNNTPIGQYYTGAEQEVYLQSGFVGIWDARARYGTWTGNYSTMTFRMTEVQPYDFGYPEEPSCPEDYYWNDDTEQCEFLESPILIPLNNQAIKLTDVAGGVMFDHDGDGIKEATAWTTARTEVAFLAIDRNGNGTIDNGTELFGNNTVPGKKNGFAALQALSGHGGGSLLASHPFFAKLLLWTDRNHNGISEADELRPAGDVLGSIGLGATGHHRKDGNGNLFRWRGWATTKGPRPLYEMGENEMKLHTKHVYDVLFCVVK